MQYRLADAHEDRWNEYRWVGRAAGNDRFDDFGNNPEDVPAVRIPAIALALPRQP